MRKSELLRKATKIEKTTTLEIHYHTELYTHPAKVNSSILHCIIWDIYFKFGTIRIRMIFHQEQPATKV